ncbi:MAG TPA: hypothetical protein VHG91_05045 [Longimicrobium sp.]|nr:hypothetical protein [Longimicrobium sp.]
MKREIIGQSGHSEPPPAVYEYGVRWQDVPVEVAREYAADLCHRHTFARVAAMVSLSKETVRKFTLGVGRPERSTVRVFAELYIASHPAGYVAEVKVPYGEPERLPQLKSVLPAGEDEARDYVRRLAELAEGDPERFPHADRLARWLETLVSAEYAADARLEERKRKPKRPRAPGAAPGEPR